MDFETSVFKEVALGLASFTISLVAADKSHFYRSTAQNLERAPRLSVGHDLVKTMGEKTTIPYAVVTGRVFPLKPGRTLDTGSGMPAVVSRLNTKELRWSESHFQAMGIGITISDSDGTKIRPALQFVPFALYNQNAAITAPVGSAVMVDDVSNESVSRFKLLQTTKSTFTPTQMTITGLLLSILRGSYSVGVEISESALPVGSVITVIGEVTMLPGKNPLFRVGKSFVGGHATPYILTTLNVKELVGYYQSWASIYKLSSILAWGCTTVAVYMLAKRLLARYRFGQVQRTVQRQRRLVNVDSLPESQICVACIQNPREVALLPCGHICICADCSLRIDQRCPVCRVNVREVVAVYLS